MGFIDIQGFRFHLVAYILVVVLYHPVPASCTREQCILDCSSPTTTDLLANLPTDDYTIDMPQRLVGPTARDPSIVQPYPHALAPFPLESHEFCQLGCAFFFSEYPELGACGEQCDKYYETDTTVGASDLGEKARLECRDGCEIAALRCRPGFSCQNGKMLPCPPGTYRDVSYSDVQECVPYPVGTYRSLDKGRSKDSCIPCPSGTYLNSTASTSRSDCQHCPYGRHSGEKGAAVCTCISSIDCYDE